MKRKRQRELHNAILSHIAKTIRGEMLDWDSLKGWLDFKFSNEHQEDVAEIILLEEAERLEKRIKI